ncbi:MAG TPA: hypothetical protein VFV80_02455 [Geminicoccaceae bacterium]|nr:hypothetical protein [Geminicoccaceae bacterium]
MQMVRHARQPSPARAGTPAVRPPLRYRPLPRPRRPSRLLAPLLWLLRLVFVQPVGRRARAERLAALPDRALRDLGLRRADLQAAALGMLRLPDLLRYPSAGPLYICGRAGFRPTLARLCEAA